MRRIEVKQLDYDLTPVAGLALLDEYPKALHPAWQRLDGAALPVRSGVADSDALRNYCGLLDARAAEMFERMPPMIELLLAC